jgi:5-oxoprolinase (ATP-hydrolysing) subunit B
MLARFSEGSLAEANAAARGLTAALEARRFPEIEDLVPGARSLMVVLAPGFDPPAELLTSLRRNFAGASFENSASRLFEIEVAYGGAGGPDLADVARGANLSEKDVILRHSEALYTVGFLGFAPGFAYLLGLPPELATPRLATPRTRVPGGSVAIGGGFTGIYPRETAGGWRLIGQTDIELFDPHRRPPSLFRPGDRVRFVPR